MKKQLLLAPLAALFALASQAQVVINEADFASPGDVVYMGQATNLPVGTTPGNAGTGQTWNFSNFVPSAIDTVNFVDPTTLPQTSSFPTANISFKQMNGDAYLNKSASGIELLGFSGTLGQNSPLITSNFEPAETIIKFPAQVGTSYTDSAYVKLDLYIGPQGQGYIDSIRVRRLYTIENTVDAEGALTTPQGTYNAIRSKVNEVVVDSMWAYALQENVLFGIVQGWQPLPAFIAGAIGVDGAVTVKTTRNYRWLANNSKFYLVDMSVDVANNNPTSARYQEDPTTPLQTAIDENAANAMGVKLYPNPTNNELFIELPAANSAYTMSIYSTVGQLVLSRIVNSSTWHDVSSLTSGIYVVNISSGNQSFTQKLVKY